MTQHIKILDGGMGRELARVGAPFRQPEWSALALYEAPERVREVHDSYVAAGAGTLTTNSYAVVPFHIGDERFAADGQRLAALAGQLARQAADAAAHPVQVAGSLPPALGSYRPDLFEAGRALEIHRVLVEAQTPYVDVWLGETISSIAEADAIQQAVAGQPQPLWLSFSLHDDPDHPRPASTLRSGESIDAAVSSAVALGAANILFNCSHPEVMLSAIEQATATLQRLGSSAGIGVYANAFEHGSNGGGANEGLSGLRKDTHPEGYLHWAQEWVAAGATLVGGCCGIGPEHIQRLASALK
ncbi:homocysteine S-methyltransferase family protein [Erwinia persicina]|uniref:Homocysteine S-methyltransferase family protein n=1 Tax=Erwinia persicina TaxID=55211 RepID=A0A4U3FMT5_9GAMM|nr:homocysteine S-methyltransferase family protein [Erwinia persicina]MBD8106511.1 homocysteine S-methyltransferase family protein [Erwinia persicina]MBD8209116.1 homocysteine S-methyltransferase family protein [Erwinia persicina]MCQ4094491.1 homocysteine S-methyltransferase family protein [Erwinia persicina]MCQ4101287.1 homocysteine S-methyltransferase family protein [Erwinia persicina]MCQ4104989.1 homocysteine S-methyltransferase family protein [Erwinia persicina]